LALTLKYFLGDSGTGLVATFKIFFDLIFKVFSLDMALGPGGRFGTP
jgi:hypothetical protein